jgi:DNA helicase HerA-like ATPase
MTDTGDSVEAARKALEEAQAALAAAEQAAKDAEAKAAAEEESAAAPADATPAAPASAAPASAPPAGPLDQAGVDAIRAGYAFDAPALEMGALVNGDALADVPIRIPLAMVNRHGLVAGATGTGKTKTLQVLAEQLSAAGVPVFAADIKGDLSGIASPGESNEKLLARTKGLGQDWAPHASPTALFALGGDGIGTPIRASVEGFGAVMLAKVLGLNQTQESSLGLVFHYAREQQLPLVTLDDLRAVLQHLTGPAGKAELENLGGLSKATAGVILRELVAFAEQGADVFFGLPQIDTADFFRTETTPDGVTRGVVSLLEVRSQLGRPELFSTFLMWLLTRLYEALPEVGDVDKPKLVFFFDEAHLLFRDASEDFLAIVTQTVRLIRSRGVGIYFVTQTPKDVPSDVLAQLGSRIQHQLRAHTPDDAKALKSTVSTYPNSRYELGEVLTTLAIGEAIVTVMNEKGAPSPVAWTRLRAPEGSMNPTPDAALEAAVAASPLAAKYAATATKGAGAILAERATEAAAAAGAPAATSRATSAEIARAQKKAEQDAARQAKAAEAEAARAARERKRQQDRIEKEVVSGGLRIARDVINGLFKKR